MSFVSGFQRVAVFISGGGSCLQTLLDLPEFQNISLVVTNQKNILGELKARRCGVEVVYMTTQSKSLHHTQKNASMSFDQLHQILKKKRIQKVFLAGFMKIIPESFLELWKNQIFNIHPSLLPQFKGLNAFEKAFDAHSDIGATIHHVIPEMDAGEIVLQMKSSKAQQGLNRNDSNLFLRRSEQHLIREYSQKGSILCIRF